MSNSPTDKATYVLLADNVYWDVRNGYTQENETSPKKFSSSNWTLVPHGWKVIPQESWSGDNRTYRNSTESFATLITNKYHVKAHYTDVESNSESSFSGTLFQNKEMGAYVKAISKSNTNRQTRPFR